MISGYYTALERTLFFGDVDAASLRLWEVNVRVHEEGQKLVKNNCIERVTCKV